MADYGNQFHSICKVNAIYIYESNREREREKKGKITKPDEIIIANGSKHKRAINNQRC